jgi:hypothetical protein
MQKTLRTRSVNELIGSLCSLILVVLALLGMTGVVYHILAPDGMIGPWIARLWINHPVYGSLVLIGLVTMGLAARGQAAPRHRNSGNSDLSFYVFVALGTFFAAKWLMYGTL